MLSVSHIATQDLNQSTIQAVSRGETSNQEDRRFTPNLDHFQMRAETNWPERRTHTRKIREGRREEAPAE